MGHCAIISHGVRILDDEMYFREAAEKLLRLLAESQKKPVHQNARDFSVGEMGVLRCLCLKEEPMSAGELSRAMAIGSGGVANLLNVLEKKGYVQRTMNPDDRRSVRVSLSASGRELVECKGEEAMRMTVGLLTRLGREDTEQLVRIYQKMLDIYENYLRSSDWQEGKKA